MKGKYLFWSIFIIGGIISIISGIAIFLPNTNYDLYDNIFFLATGLMVLMLAGRRVKEFVDEDREFKLSLLTLIRIHIVLDAFCLAFRSLYRLIFMIPI